MYQKMKAYIQEYHMLQEQDKVIAGVSGGPDSICLLFMLLRLKKEMKIKIGAYFMVIIMVVVVVTAAASALI